MNMQKETTSWILIGHIGVQACAVGAGLTYHYSQRQIASVVLTIEAPRYTMQDILYGAITKPQLNHPTHSSHIRTKELSINLIGSTTGSSGDFCTLSVPV